MLTLIELGSTPQSGRTTIMTSTLNGLQQWGFTPVMVKPTVEYAISAIRHHPGRHAAFPIACPRSAMMWLEDRSKLTEKIAIGLDDANLFDTRPIIDELTALSEAGRNIILITAS